MDDAQLQRQLARLWSDGRVVSDPGLNLVMGWLKQLLDDVFKRWLFDPSDDEAARLRQRGRTIWDVIEAIRKAYEAEQAQKSSGNSGTSRSVL